jgi:hypothetical protein
LQKGSTIYIEGDKTDAYYVLISGQVTIHSKAKMGGGGGFLGKLRRKNTEITASNAHFRRACTDYGGYVDGFRPLVVC